MSNMRMKHKLIMSMMAGAIIIPGSVVRTQAAESGDSEKSLVPVTGKHFGSIISDRNKEQYQSVSGADRRGRVFEYSVF